MRLRITLLLPVCGALALSACGGDASSGQNAGAARPDEVAAPNAAEPHSDAQRRPPPASADAPSANTAQAASGGPAAIPAALHGRWALQAADCAASKGAATGLMTVTADELRFYESRARPIENVSATDNSFSATFAFDGEGQTWTSQQRLRRLRNELLRTEGSQTESIAYVRCQ